MAGLWPGPSQFQRSLALRLALVVVAWGLVGLAACGPRQTRALAPSDDPCISGPEVRGSLDTVTIVLAEPAFPSGDTTAGDRFVRRLLRGPSAGLDCRGAGYRPTGREPRYRIVEADGGGATRLVRSNGRGGPSLIVVRRVPSDTDLRDHLDRGADLLFTTDARSIEYAGAHPEFVLLGTGARRSYYLVSLDGERVEDPSMADRSDLASRAVRGAVIPLEGAVIDTGCVRSRADRTRRQSVVVYPSDDAVARQLAERVAALAARRGRPAWVPDLGQEAHAEGLDRADDLRELLFHGEPGAGIVAAESGRPLGCAIPRGAHIAPLVAASYPVIVRRGLPPVRWSKTELTGFEPTVEP